MPPLPKTERCCCGQSNPLSRPGLTKQIREKQNSKWPEQQRDVANEGRVRKTKFSQNRGQWRRRPWDEIPNWTGHQRNGRKQKQSIDDPNANGRAVCVVAGAIRVIPNPFHRFARREKFPPAQ